MMFTRTNQLAWSSKFETQAETGILLGCDDYGEYTVEIIKTRKIIHSVHVKFDEDFFPAYDLEEAQTNEIEETTYSNYSPLEKVTEDTTTRDSGYESEHSEESNSETESESEDEPFAGIDFSDDESEDTQQYSTSNNAPNTRKSSRKSKQTKLYDPSAGKFYNPSSSKMYKSNMIRITITTSDSPYVKESFNSKITEQDLWKKSIDSELNTLHQKATWSPVSNRFKPKFALPTHIVLKIKRDENGKIA